MRIDNFVSAQYAPLLRAAFLLTGEQARAEDLAHDTLVRIMQKWSRVAAADDPVAYCRRVMLNLFLSGRRRRWNHEAPTAELPERDMDLSPYSSADDRDGLRRALMALSPRQRAAIVLRHYEQQTEAQTAAVLGCSVGTVKSLTSRGLSALRQSPALAALEST